MLPRVPALFILWPNNSTVSGHAVFCLLLSPIEEDLGLLGIYLVVCSKIVRSFVNSVFDFLTASLFSKGAIYHVTCHVSMYCVSSMLVILVAVRWYLFCWVVSPSELMVLSSSYLLKNCSFKLSCLGFLWLSNWFMVYISWYRLLTDCTTCKYSRVFSAQNI